MNNCLVHRSQPHKRFKSPRAYRRWLSRQGQRVASAPTHNTQSGLEALEQRTLLSAAPVFELSDLLGANGGDGSAGVVIEGFSLNDRSGISVNSAGDINGDGYDDVIIGAFQDAPNGVDSGASFVVFGQPGGFGATLGLSSLNGANGFRINGVAGGDLSGRSVSAAGDVNGDGLDDLLIGAFSASPNGVESGQAYVVYGKGTAFAGTLELSSLNGTNGFTIDGVSAGDQLGIALNGAGDVNGDGLDDFILGAAGASPNGAGSGAAYVVFGQTGFGASFDLTTLNGTNGFVIEGDSAGDSLGISVNGAGDVNADGLADIIVGAHLDATSGAGSGSAYVVFGKTSAFGSTLDVSTLNGTNGFALRGTAAGDNAGRAVSSAGDFNGDGFGDLLIGAPRSTGAAVDSGSAYVVYGQGGVFASSLNLSALNGADGFQLDGVDAGDRAGLRVSVAGDVNADGLDDLLIGARRAAPNGTRSGEAYVVLGRTAPTPASLNLSALTGADGFVLNGIDPLDIAADSIGYAGDVNGDGFADFIIGASNADPNGGESGESYLLFGGDFSDAVTHLGLQVSDSITGTAGGDVILGRRGDDILTGNGGADVILGGQGDDSMAISDLSFVRVDGGSGADTLVVDGSGITLDLTAIADSRLAGIEAIDIRGGANTVTLNLQEVLNLSNSSNTLRVFRDGLGSINIGAGWSQTGSQVVNGNQETTFTQGNATLVLVVELDILDPIVTVDPLTTDVRSPELTGTVVDLDPATTVEVTVNGTDYAATNNGDGTWTLPAGTIAPDLADGFYEILAVGTDTSNNTGSDTSSNELLVDNDTPVVTVNTLTTSDNSPQLTGTIEDIDPTTTVSVNVGGTDYAATNNGDGTWTLAAGTIAPVLTDGVHAVTATATDTVGHSDIDSTTSELTVDTVLPIVTMDDPGTTSDTSPELTGTVTDVDATALVEVLVGGATIAATNNGDGTWTLAQGTINPLPEGDYVINVRVTDAAGNEGFVDTLADLTIDTAPVVTVNSRTTSDPRPELTGTVIDIDTAAVVTVTVNGIAYVAVNNGDGTWTLPNNAIAFADKLADGVYDVAVSALDDGGNTGTDTSTDELTIDTSAPIVTVDALATNDTTPELTGTVSDADASIVVTVDGVQHAAVNNGDGTWTLLDNTITAQLAEGTFDVSVTATNAAVPPVDGSDATTDELTIDSTSPVVSFDELLTADTTPALTGTIVDADPDVVITVIITGGGAPLIAVNNGDGTWTVPDDAITTPLAPGTYAITVTAVDAAGNLGNHNNATGLTIDTVAPVVAVDSLTTDVVSPQLTGTVVDLDPATTVAVTVNGTEYAATNNGDGTWTLPAGTITPDLADGTYDILVVGTDTVGNSGSDLTSGELFIDTAAPVVTVDPLSTSDNTPQLTGTVVDLDPATTISINVGGTDYAATNNGDGTWTLAAGTISPALADGLHEVVATATDSLGHIGTDASTNELTIDTSGGAVDLSDLLPVNGGDGTLGVIFTGVADGDLSGNWVSSAGDINGDGFDDIVIGATGADPGGSQSGAVYVVFGQAGGFPAVFDLSTLNGTNGLRVDGLLAGDDLGVSVASAGDINGDGLDDLVLGASKTDTNANRSGTAYIIYGKSTPFTATFDLTTLNGINGYKFDGEATSDRAGFSVSGAGDVNGDGLQDVMISSVNGDDGVVMDGGRTYIVYGSTAAMPATLTPGALTGANGFILTGPDASGGAGFNVSNAGDVNGDGIGDMIIGAPGTTVGGLTGAGKVFVVFGQTAGFGAELNLSTLNGTNGFVIEGDTLDMEFGFNVSSIGDFNADGFGDVLIGAPESDQVAGTGSAYVVFGQAGAFPATMTVASLNGANGFKLQGIDVGDDAGFSVSGVGDVNGDGIDDLIVGARGGDPNSGANRGESYLLFGSTGPFSANVTLASIPGNGGLVFNGINNIDFSGRAVSGAGDVNGDGFDDLLVSAREADVTNPNNDAGETYLIFGRDFTGAVTQTGGATGEVFNGTGTRDVIIAGGGDDELIGNGGSDVLRGGEGDDIHGVSDAGFARVAGGNGFDTLRLDGGGIVLDLTTISDARITGIERIDTRGSGANTLTVNVLEVLNLSDTTNTLLILQNPGDTVDIGTGWTNTGTELIDGKTFDIFTQGLATVKIFIDDTTAPVVTIDPLATFDTTPQLTGTVIDADLLTGVEVTVNGVTYTATNNGDGTWALADDTITPALAEGTYDVSVTATDTALNVGSDATTDELVVDTTDPVVTIDPLTTSDTTPRLTGTIIDADPLTTIQILVGGGVYAATNNGDGTWTLADDTITPALAEATHEVIALATDPAGNIGEDSTADELVVDLTLPVVTVSALTTSDSTPQLTGTIDDTTAAISVTVNGIVYAATNNGSGTWTLADDTITPALAAGTYDVSVTATDTALNVGSDATTDELVVEITLPVVTIDPLTTSDTTPQLTGTVDDTTATISVTVNGIVYAATNNGNGTWTLANDTITPALAEGTYDVSVTATDAALNVGSDATANELVVDTTDPVVTIDSLTTSDTTPELTGTIADADPATTIQVLVGGGVYAATNNGDGTWTLADDTITPALAEATHQVIVLATDSAGNIGSDSTTDELVIEAPGLPGDANGDGFVGVDDLNIVLLNWNQTNPADPRADLNGDNFVGIDDMNIVLLNWNNGTPPVVQAIATSASSSESDPVDGSVSEVAQSAETQPVIEEQADQPVVEPVSSSVEAPTPVQVQSETTPDPLDREPSVLDQVKPQRATQQGPSQEIDQAHAAAAWRWMHDEPRGLNIAFGLGEAEEDGRASSSALDMAKPLPGQSAISRLR